jgi:acyl-CoA synthetase (AMP-forming)/AMP-acid ligase II
MNEGWTFAGVWESVADAYPDWPAQSQGDRHFTWAQFDRRADGIARTLLQAGLQRQAKVGQYLFNCPEYLESMFGIFKAGLAPVNVNYRYNDDELVYLWQDADVEAVVFDSAFTEICDRVRRRLPEITCWIRVSVPGQATNGPLPDWAIDYETAARAADERVAAAWGRSGSDLYLLYTGGTTGLPKGVMWPQENLFRYLESLSRRQHPDRPDWPSYAASIVKPGPRVVPAPPLMHGAGAWFSMTVLCRGGSVVTLVKRSFDPIEVLDTLVGARASGLAVVGESFARPLADALDQRPDQWDLSGLKVIVTSGAALGVPTKERLRQHVPGVLVVDALGSSETGAIAQAKSGANGADTDSFTLKPGSKVIGEDGREVEPGSGRAGRMAVSGPLPLGYYKDPVKSAQSFVTIDGVPHAFTGDWALVQADGVTIRLLGRGSQCINTGGEKVFAEEVEEVVMAHPAVADAVVVGVSDATYGQAVTAVVQARPGSDPSAASVIEHVRERLAHYKAPRHVVFVDSIGRASNGKADPNALRALAEERLGLEPSGTAVPA